VPGDFAVLADDGLGRISAYVATLARIPVEPRWVLIGGLAVNVRVGKVHRATNDIDTMSRDQPAMVEILAERGAERLAAGKVQFVTGGVVVEVDVMNSTDDRPGGLPAGDEEQRAFDAARRWTMRTATLTAVRVIDLAGTVVADCEIEVASPAALVALKTVAIPRRVPGEDRVGHPGPLPADRRPRSRPSRHRVLELGSRAAPLGRRFAPDGVRGGKRKPGHEPPAPTTLLGQR